MTQGLKPTNRVPEVVIIGAGIAGLMLATKLSEAGIRAMLIEHADTLGRGASLRNEGWLHNGTYHAFTQGAEVARRCLYGHQRLRAFAPEAVDLTTPFNIALCGSSEVRDKAVEAWRRARVPFESITPADLRALEPQLNFSLIEAAYRVDDVSVDTRIIFRKLIKRLQVFGGDYVLEATTTLIDPPSTKLEVKSPAHADAVFYHPHIIVYTAGYATASLLRDTLDVEIAMRYNKSHLLAMRRCLTHGVFFLDPGMPAIMNHVKGMIVGLNEDAQPCAFPNFSTVTEEVERLFNGLHDLVPVVEKSFEPVACIKVDVPQNSQDPRSVDIRWEEPRPGHIWMLPGKMTEAPFITDYMVNLVLSRLPHDRLPQRPLDSWLAMNESLT